MGRRDARARGARGETPTRAAAHPRHKPRGLEERCAVTPTAVIQVKQGIGDVIWHLPCVRAIAAAEPGGAVTFLAPPTSHAKELLQAEPCIADVIDFEHGGSQL